MKIEQIPDYAALRQIQEALWGTSEVRGAAVLVGAGFSRNAELPAQNSTLPPLWADFHREMEERLYPRGGGPHDSLRLAEEYRAALGDQALEGLIHHLVRNSEWQPGPLHRELVNLPWADVLTTNWDTLLERAAETNLQQSYDVVRTIPDIARTRAPRIVKLHGTLPSNRPFIFTEEDYRTYPKKFAPFVNLVQQVLLENELCLIGFSGDDPNFLQWSGWVRDQLGAASRRIYLVGVFDLLPARRKLLETRNVSLIDLTSVVEDVADVDKQAVATERFLDFLRASRPRPSYDWPTEEPASSSNNTSRDPEIAAQRLKEAANRWKRERESYPGWLVCPHSERQRLRFRTDENLHMLLLALEKMSDQDQGAVVFEIAWRFDTSFWPAPALLKEAIEKVITGGHKHRLQLDQRHFLALFLTRTAREEDNKECFTKWLTLMKAESSPDSEDLAEAYYEQCLWHRNHLEYDQLLSILGHIQGRDPIWKLRNASLRFELGDADIAGDLIREGLRTLRDKHTRDRKSIWIISRLGWTLFVARASDLGKYGSTKNPDVASFLEDDEWPIIFRKTHCDPWDELHSLDRSVDDELTKKEKDARSKEPRFDAGSFRDHSTSIRFASWSNVSAVYEVNRIAEVIGLPMIANHVDIFESHSSHAAELYDEVDHSKILSSVRALRRHDEGLIEKRFGRINIARMPFDKIEEVSDCLWNAIEFFSKRFTRISNDGQERFDTFCIERVRIYTELLSRLVVRLPSASALASFQRASNLLRDPKWVHWWLFKPLENLLTRSFKTIDPEERGHLVLEVLNLPLPDEHEIKGQERDWPELVSQLNVPSIERPQDDRKFAQRIAALVEKTRSSEMLTRERSILRLTFLSEGRALTEGETVSFGEALWARRHSPELFPSETNLHMHMMLALPSPDPQQTKHTFEKVFLSLESLNKITEEQLIIISQATRKRRDGTQLISLNSAQAIHLFDSIMGWHPSTGAGFDGFIQQSNRTIERCIGGTLANAVFPAFSKKEIAERNLFGDILELIDSNRAPSALEAIPQAICLFPTELQKGTQCLQRCLLMNHNDVVFSAFNAVHRWLGLEISDPQMRLPKDIAEIVFSIIAARREPGLIHALHIAPELVDTGYLTKDNRHRLIDALDALRIETAYETWDNADTKTTTLTLIRAHCVRLADKLNATGDKVAKLDMWLQEALNDPMPEVRYALKEFND